jgi:hypothetical protein
MRHLTRTFLAGIAGALTVVVLFGASGGRINQISAVASPLTLSGKGVLFPDGTLQTTAAARDPRRSFYLTVSTYAGADADGSDQNGAAVCAIGFHFASMWEILDVSSLRYDTTKGYVRPDSGQGPPSNTSGWIRTGYNSSSVQTNSNAKGDAGLVNCSAWESSSSLHDGTRAWLSRCWQEGADCSIPDVYEPMLAPWWQAGDTACNLALRVWCVEDYPGSGA